LAFEKPAHAAGDAARQGGELERQAASRYLKALTSIGVLREQAVRKEKLFVHPKLMRLLTHDSNAFEPYANVRAR
jgi:hypothetical protein